MDFIVGLPNSQGHTTVMVVVDRLSKYVHFGALKPKFDAPRVARLFVETVVKLHSFPEKLLSDRDAIFMSDMWNELMSLSGTKLQFTTAYHPQTDGQSEVTNRALEQYLRSFTFDQPARWSQLLPWAELALNCSYNTSIGMSPFQALYGREPPSIFATPAHPAKNGEAAALLEDRMTTLRKLRDNIRRAQEQMSASANRHRRDVEYRVGDRVLLRLQPYRQHSVGKPLSAKLGRRFYGPYEITERIGKVAYRLKLPVESRIHDVFHVSLLKPFIPPFSDDIVLDLPVTFHRGNPLDVPVRASAERTILLEGIPQQQWLVHWATDPEFNPSWEPKEELQRHFPFVHLEDKAVSKGGGVDTTLDPTTTGKPHLVDEHDNMEPDQSEVESIDTMDVESTRMPSSSSKSRKSKRNRSKPAKFKDYEC